MLFGTWWDSRHLCAQEDSEPPNRHAAEVQEETFIVQTCTPIQPLCQMLAKPFYHLWYNMHIISQASMHAFSLSLSAQPPSHTQTQPVSWWSRTRFPKINKTLFKSCSSIKLIFIVSAHSPRGQEIFVFYLPLMCKLGRYFRVCAYRVQICISVLYSVDIGGKQAHPRHRWCPLFVSTLTLELMSVMERKQRLWAHFVIF